MTEPVPSGVDAYAALVRDELEAQEKRKTSFEQRGLAVVTTSGTLVTLLFALAAFSTKTAATFSLPVPARHWLTTALVLFVGAAVLALLTNLPLSYQSVEVDGVERRLKENPVRSGKAATTDIALTRAKALRDAKRKNTLKGWFLICSLGVEVLAVSAVAVAICQIL